MVGKIDLSLPARLVLNVIFMLLFYVSPTQAQELPGGVITFLFDNNSRTANLYLMDADGQNVRRAASDIIAGNGAYSLSPDGRQVVYHHASNELRVLDLETGEERTIFKQAGNSTVNLLSWAPDGRQFTFATAFATDIGVEVFVRSMDAATGHQTVLFSYVNSPNADQNILNAIRQINWTPDGHQILYQFDQSKSGEPYNAVEEFRQVNLDGSGDTVLYQFSTSDINSTHLWLRLSPDGQFVLQNTNTYGEVEIVALNGSRMRLATEPRQPIEAYGSGSAYAWMPDGTTIFSIAIGAQGDQAAVGQFILRKFDVERGQWTDIISEGDAGRAPRCGAGATCIRDIRWHTPTAAADPIVIETLPPADDQTVWNFDAGLDSWTGYVESPSEDSVDTDNDWRPTGALDLSGLEAPSSDNNRPDSWIMRSVQLPADATRITLVAGGIELGAKSAGSEFLTDELGYLRILLRDEALNWHTLLGWQPIDGLEWLTFEADLSAFAGQTVTLSVEQDGPMTVYLDQVAIE